jgi:hypothetical protein
MNKKRTSADFLVKMASHEGGLAAWPSAAQRSGRPGMADVISAVHPPTGLTPLDGDARTRFSTR